jgi:hypothetical protein
VGKKEVLKTSQPQMEPGTAPHHDVGRSPEGVAADGGVPGDVPEGADGNEGGEEDDGVDEPGEGIGAGD